jgi:hypothetical protein
MEVGMRRVMFTVVLLAGLAACSDSLSPADLTGTWTGTTSQGRALGFRVVDAGLDRVTLSYHLDGVFCSYDSDTEFTLGTPLEIVDLEFEAVDFSLGPGTTLTVSGAFTSASEASGSASVDDGDCGGTANFTWTAEKN